MLAYPEKRKVFIADWRKFGQAPDLISSIFRRDPCVLQWSESDAKADDSKSASPAASSASASASAAAAGHSHTVSRLESKDLDYYAENLSAVRQLHPTVMIPFDSHLQPLHEAVRIAVLLCGCPVMMSSIAD
jgi:hypothetical protein